jgi:hypothetical protein
MLISCSSPGSGSERSCSLPCPIRFRTTASTPALTRRTCGTLPDPRGVVHLAPCLVCPLRPRQATTTGAHLCCWERSVAAQELGSASGVHARRSPASSQWPVRRPVRRPVRWPVRETTLQGFPTGENAVFCTPTYVTPRQCEVSPPTTAPVWRGRCPRAPGWPARRSGCSAARTVARTVARTAGRTGGRTRAGATASVSRDAGASATTFGNTRARTRTSAGASASRSASRAATTLSSR